MSLLKAMLWWGLVVTPDVATKAPQTTIFVAAVDLPSGTVLTPSMVVELALPESAVTLSMVTSLEPFVNETMHLPTLKGEPLLDSYFWVGARRVKACDRLAPATARDQVAHHRRVVRERLRR